MTGLLKQIQPDHLFDLTAANALYRPGPMNGGVTWDYARIKRGDKESPEWSKDELAWPVVGETYGLIAYQEQVMELSKRFGNFTPAQADDLRKAMGKLYRIKGHAAREFMQGFHQLWVDGCKANGVSSTIRDQVWEYMLGFGAYGFNKSHSGYYSFVAYKDAWLKRRYPLEFLAAILTFPSGSTPQAKQDFINAVVREAKSRGIKFLPPHINRSELAWSIDNDIDGKPCLRFGFSGIKDVGDIASSKIIINRVEDFESIDDVRGRCGTKVNKKVLEALTEAGAFECFGARDDASATQIAMWEKDRLKMVINGVSEVDKYSYLIDPNIYSQEEVEAMDNGDIAVVGGEIMRVDFKKTKKDKRFANITVSYGMNEWRVRFWESELLAYEELLVVGGAIMVHGRKDEWNGIVSVIAKEATDLQTLAAEGELSDDYLEDVA